MHSTDDRTKITTAVSPAELERMWSRMFSYSRNRLGCIVKEAKEIADDAVWALSEDENE